MTKNAKDECSKLWKNNFFSVLSRLYVVACAIVYFIVLWSRLTGRSTQTYIKCSFFSIFSRLVPFPQVFGQVNRLLLLKLHKIKYVRHIFACPIVLVLFYDQGCQGGVFKVIKKYFLVFYVVWILFPKILGRLRSALY